MDFEVTILVLVAVAVAAGFLFALVNIDGSDAKSRKLRAKSAESRREIEAHQRAIENYKGYVALQRRAALTNYHVYLRQKRAIVWKRRKRHSLNRLGGLIREAFPEMANSESRGAILRAIVLQLIQSLIDGQGPSPQWRKQMNEFIQDVDGIFAMRQALNSWYRERQAEIQAEFDADNISQEEMEAQLEGLEDLYHDALQEIQFS